MSEKNNSLPEERQEGLKVWKSFLIAVMAHAVIVAVLSPTLLGREDTSPETLIERARELAEEGHYEDSLKVYEEVISQKPDIPAVFTEAEEELEQTRRTMLEEKKQEKADDSENEEDEGEDGDEDDPPEEDREEDESEQEPEPDEDLPDLPDL